MAAFFESSVLRGKRRKGLHIFWASSGPVFAHDPGPHLQAHGNTGLRISFRLSPEHRVAKVTDAAVCTVPDGGVIRTVGCVSTGHAVLGPLLALRSFALFFFFDSPLADTWHDPVSTVPTDGTPAHSLEVGVPTVCVCQGPWDPCPSDSVL
ncbi:hypothetical protein JEQ12_008183 [Ovis aries]|uniref:Uncharacterized protein n=1 Tax=Ovis aries TaxID=9940 RepID=A0A836CTX6_SHEEP|nr:hypothetical protein JEQ12_008183 [Ovis aries]